MVKYSNQYKTINTNMIKDREKQLTVSQFAKLLGVSKKTIMTWQKSGNLIDRRNKINNQRVFYLSDIDVFKKNNIKEVDNIDRIKELEATHIKK